MSNEKPALEGEPRKRRLPPGCVDRTNAFPGDADGRQADKAAQRAKWLQPKSYNNEYR
jgi:hypothetical protein